MLIFIFSTLLINVSPLLADKNQNNKVDNKASYPPYEPKDGDRVKRLEYTCYYEAQMKDWESTGKKINQTDSDNHLLLKGSILKEECDKLIFGDILDDFERNLEFTAETKEKWQQCRVDLKEDIKNEILRTHQVSFQYFKKIVKECRNSVHARPKNDKQVKEKREAIKYCLKPLIAYIRLKPNTSSELLNYHNLHKIAYRAVTLRYKDLKDENRDPETGKTRCRCEPEEKKAAAKLAGPDVTKRKNSFCPTIPTPTPIFTPTFVFTIMPTASPTVKPVNTTYISPTPSPSPTPADTGNNPTLPPSETPPYD